MVSVPWASYAVEARIALVRCTSLKKKFSRKLKEQMKNSRLLQPDKSTLLFYATKNSRLLQPDKSTLLFYEAIAEKIFKTNYEVLVVKVIPVNP